MLRFKSAFTAGFRFSTVIAAHRNFVLKPDAAGIITRLRGGRSKTSTGRLCFTSGMYKTRRK